MQHDQQLPNDASSWSMGLLFEPQGTPLNSSQLFMCAVTVNAANLEGVPSTNYDKKEGRRRQGVIVPLLIIALRVANLCYHLLQGRVALDLFC